MSYTAPTVNYSATINGTYTSLTGIQSVSINRGRQRFQDNFPQTSCVIELIPANSYTLAPAVGQFIDVRDTNSASSPCYFAGQITDVSRKFEMPYNSGTGAAPGDRITITATGGVGALGKSSVTNYSVANDLALRLIGIIGVNNRVFNRRLAVSSIKSSAQTFTGGVLDLINTLLRTTQFLIDDMDLKRNFFDTVFTQATVVFPVGQGNLKFDFSDAGTVGALKFTNLEYLSSVQDVFTEVEVVPAGLATETVVSGVPPYNTLVYNTFNESALDANNLAQFILSTQDVVQITPFSVSTNTFVAPTCTDISKTTNVDALPGPTSSVNLGSAVSIEFRGTTVEAFIQGINTNFYMDHATVQLYLSPALGAPFVLDSVTFGVLDQNKLGF
jgi:hypothetical protein